MKRMLLSALLGMVLACIMPAALASGINNYFIIPDSDTRLLTEEELWGWQYEAVGYIYNEIFARHGRPFRAGEKYDGYFRSQAWYQVNSQYRYGLLNSVEQANERLAHQVLEDMRARNTLNPQGRPLPLSNAQANPQTVLDFRAYDLSPNQKLDVYSGPGTGYYRSANGKASVSTNGSVWIAGRENGWLAIAYETNGGSRRIGYIDMSRLKDNLNPQSLNLSRTGASIARACSMTDEPDGSCAEMAWLVQDTQVTCLGPYTSRSGESWAYIEVSGIRPMRGFVPAGCVSASGGSQADYDWDDEDAYWEENG